MSWQATDKNGNVIRRTVPAFKGTISGSGQNSMTLAAQVSFGPGNVEFENGNGSSRTWSVQVSSGNTTVYPEFTASSSSTLSGSFEYSSFSIELRFDVSGGGSANPWFNGVPDGVPESQVRYYWYITEGQSVSSTLSIDGVGSATANGTSVGAEYQGYVQSQIYIYQGTGNMTVAFPIPGSVPTQSVSYTSPDGSASATANYSTGASTVTLSNGSGLWAGASGIVFPDITLCIPYQILIDGATYPDSLSISAIRGGDTLLTPEIIVGPSGTIAATQLRYNGEAGITVWPEGGPLANQSVNVDTYGPVSLSITTDSLKAQGEDYVVPGYGVDTTPRITRLPFRGRTFPAIAVTHAESYAVPNWNDIDHWTGTSGASVALDTAGNIVITAGTEKSGGATFAYPVSPDNTNVHHAVSGLSYRFLNVTTPTGSASPSFSVTIPACSVYIDSTIPPPPFFADAPGSIGPPEDVYSGPATPAKRWNVDANVNGLQDCGGDIDLCGPDLVSFGTDPFTPLDPSMPLDRGTRWPIPSRMMACQGVWRIEQIAIDGIPAGETLTISSLSLRRRNQPTYDGLDQWNRGRLIETQNGDEMDPDWESGQTWAASTLETEDGESHTSHYERRGVLSVVDGKQAVEEAVFWYSYFEGASGTDYHIFETDSIAQTVAKINAQDGVLGIPRYPGVVATSLRPITPDCASSGYSDDIKTDTCYFNETGAAAWLCNHDTSIGITTDESTGVATLYARPLFDQIIPCFWLDWNQIEPVGVCSPDRWDDDWLWKQFEAIAVLRGTAQGLYLAATDKKTPQAGINFELIETDNIPAGSEGSVRGSSVTSSPGFYSTGLPGGRGPNVSHKVVSTDTTPNVSIPFVGTDWRARYRHRATSCGDFSLCCTTQLGDPMTFSPFAPQFSDPSATPDEEWRRVGGGTGFGESAQATVPSASEQAENNENAA